MRVMRGLAHFAVVAVTVLTLMLGAAVAVSAHSGTFGSSHGTSTVSILDNHIDFSFLKGKQSGDGQGSNGHQGDGCDGNNDHHDHGTPGHKHHPCGNKGDDTD